MLQLGSTPIHFQRLYEISTRATSRSQMRGAEVTRLVDTLRDTEPSHRPISWRWFVGIVVFSFVAGFLWPIWLRIIIGSYRYICKRVPTPTKPRKPLAIRNTNASGNDLQDMQLSSEATFIEEVPQTTPSQLTAFVQHGVVTVAD